jgi:hypothetical protein
MQRQAVESSTLRSAGYDAPSRTLEIEFQNGHVYRYFGVPRSVYDSLMAASSKGQYFNQCVKAVYAFEKVQD